MPFCCPCHVHTSMKKVVDLLVKTPKNLYGKRDKPIRWVIITIKSFLLNLLVLQPPHEKEPLVILVGNDINQCVNVINQQNNINSPTIRLKRWWQKNMGA